MDLKKRDFLAAGLGIGAGLAVSGAMAQDAPPAGRRGRRGGDAGGGGGDAAAASGPWKQPSSVDPNYKPRRVNKVIELWEDGQPVFYTSHGLRPGMDPYAQGKKMAGTNADCINYGLEQGPLDFTVFAEFMRGMKDAGPTKSGHATPAVFVEPPVTGLNEQYAIANTWILKNFLDIGAMGLHICHARDEKAMEVYCQMAARFEIDYPNTPKLKRPGLRGQPPGLAPTYWGISNNKYMHVADVWPLNPRGEIMMGAKIEDRYADANMAKVLAVKGLAFAEWGPTDNTQSLFGLAAYPEDQEGRGQRNAAMTAKLDDVRAKVLALCKKNNLRFLNSASATPGPSFVIDQIKDGAMIMGGNSEDVTLQAREFTKRKMPV